VLLAGCLLLVVLTPVIGETSDVQLQPSRRVLATADFVLTGLAVKVEPAHQAVPRHTATSIHTRLAGIDGDPGALLSQLNPNYRVRGDLIGPSVTSPVVLEAAIGSPMLVPPLALPGAHLITNLRVVDAGLPNTPTVAEVTPDTCSLSVFDQLLVSEVQVRELGYDEILAAGINVTSDSYSYYNFTLALGTESDAYKISIPVAMPLVPGEPPVVGQGHAEAKIGEVPPVPDVLPVLLEPEVEGGGGSGAEAVEGGTLRIPGLIIFPGRIALLHQFFEALVIVANGAPSGTPLIVQGLRARIELPQAPNPLNNPLRIAELQVGGALEELELRSLGPDGLCGTADDGSRFAPGQSGQASFLVEGLKEGLHTIRFKLQGILEGLPAGPVTVSGEVFGAIRVRDASFAVSFTHPGVVRVGQEYDLGVTLFNSGSRDILGAFADLSALRIVGADLADPAQGTERNFPAPLKPGASGTISWRLKAQVTGAVTASFVKVEGATGTCLELVTGVGDRNVPLSPDSLILPDAVRYLPSGIVEASSALLGQAWSVATAPSGSLPEGVRPVSKQTVRDRAVELGVAGLRVRFGEPLAVSLITLIRDWLGETQGTPDPGFVEIVCTTVTGFRWQDQIGEQLSQIIGSTAGVDFHRTIAEGELARSRFLSVLVAQAEGFPFFGARLVDPDGRSVGVSGPDNRFGAVAGSVLLRLNKSVAAETRSRGAFLLASTPAAGTWTLELTAWQAGTVSVSVLLPIDDDLYRQLAFTGLPLAAGATYRVRFDPYWSSGAVVEQCNSGICVPFSPNTAVSLVDEPAPRLIGVLQVGPAVLEAGDRFGRLAALLFSKPVSPANAENAASYTIGGGNLIGSNPPATVGGSIRVAGAKLNFNNRFVFLKPSSPIGPFIERNISITGVADTRGLALAGPVRDIPIETTVSPAGVPPGGYLTGRTVNADGTPISNAAVDLFDWPCDAVLPVWIAGVKTDAAGRYAFDYVVNGECSPLIARSTHPTNGSNKQFAIPVVYHGQHLLVDYVFLARGDVEGEVTLAGQPVRDAQVQITPNADPEAAQLVRSDSTGKYLALDVPVGAVSVLAVGPEGQTNATGFGAGWIDGPGKTAVVNVSLQNISGSAEGQVIGPDGKPVSRMLVIAQTLIPGIADPVILAFCYTAADGTFALSKLPLGAVRIFATDYASGVGVAQQVQLTTQMPAATGVVLTLPGFGSISGRVIDQAGNFLPMAQVQCGFATVTADPLGNYRFSMIRAGAQEVIAANAVTGLTGSTKVTVWAGQETAGADVVISAAATIKGTVSIVRSPGLPAVPLSGVKVTHDGLSVVSTNSQGAYVLPNVPPGNPFTLRIVDPTGRLAVNQKVQLGPGETLIRIVTFHPASIGGRVFQPDGQTGAVAQVSLYVPQPTLAQGQFFGLLSVERPITTLSAADGTYLVTSLNPSGFRITASNAFFPTPVNSLGMLVADGLVTCNLTLINTLGGTVTGRVYEPDGVTSVGAGIQVTLGGGYLADATVRTDESGSYAFPGVFASGIYNLTASDPLTGYSNRVRVAVEVNKDSIVDLRLLGRGSLRAKVIDAAGTPIESGTVTVTGLDYPNTTAQFQLETGGGGAVQFDDLPEGPYSVTASRQGLSGRVSAFVPLSGLVSVTLQLQPAGTVTGRLLMPDGATPVGLADVRLVLAGKAVGFTVTSDEGDIVGTFSFPDVPLGDFKLEAFDNRSTRVGRTAGRLTQNGETVSADIVLVSIGTVRGQVTANNSPVDHAYVTIQAGESGFSSMSLRATTDPAGNYLFPGVPAGSFSVEALHQTSGLTGSAQGILQGGPEPLPDRIVNIALEQSASLEGVVLDHSGTAVSGAQVTVTIGSLTLTSATRADGTFRLNYVPLGEATVRAQAPSGYDRGKAGPVTIGQPGSTVPVEVRFDGVGTVKGDAFDGDGVTPLAFGTVSLTNTEWSVPVVLTCPVLEGKYEIQGVPAGPFSLQLTVPNRTVVGAATGTLQSGQLVSIPLTLEPAGIVTGKVVRPDGTTPAVGADVKLLVTRAAGGTIAFTAYTNAAGIYRLDQVLLGSVEILVEFQETDGMAKISGLSLSTNGQVLEVPLLVLDENPIQIQSVSPTNGSIGVSRSTAVTVTFTEPAKPSSVTGGSFRLLNGASEIGASVSLSADGLAATLTPVQILPDNSTFTVIVTTQVTDLVGRKLPAEFRSTFTTPDETPPVVTSIDPAEGARQVPVDKAIQVTFNEALNPQQSFAGVVRVFPEGQPPALVPLVISLSESGKTITAQPSVPLAESTLYKIEVTAQKDLAGNIQPALYTSTFSTVDRTKPVIDSVSVEGQVLFTKTPLIIVKYHDNFSGIDPASLVLRLDGQDIRTAASVSSSEARYQVPGSAPLSPGGHTLEVQVSDLAGNQSDLKTGEFTVDNVPPTITSFTVAGQPVTDGMTVPVFRPVFAATYSDNGEVDPAATRLLVGIEGQARTEVTAAITKTGLSYQPSTDLPQGLYLVELIVGDLVGNSISTGPIHVSVDVDAPEITALAPLSGSQHGGTVIVMEGARLLQPGGGPPVVTVGGNPAYVASTQVGPPEAVAIVTPPGAPGLATVRVQTERGVGTATVFVYEADPRTPPAAEDDTVLLWHLDEAEDGSTAIADGGPLGIKGTASSASRRLPGRFGFGRSGIVTAAPVSDGAPDQGLLLSFGSSSFMLECWVKSGAITRTYALAGKSPGTWGGTYSLSVKPSGALWAHLRDNAWHYWEAVTDPASGQVTDGQWHHVALVCDRPASLLRLYVDGLERASSTQPAGFGDVTSSTHFKVGEYDASDWSAGPDEFPGAIDEVRLSANARSAARILEIMLGRDGPLPLEVTRIQPDRLIRGSMQEMRVSGYNLAGVEATLFDPSGSEHAVEIQGSAATEALLRVQLPTSGPLGDAQLRLRSDRGDAVVGLLVLDPIRSTPVVEDDTALLMHFDEESGQTRFIDSGPFAIDGGAPLPPDTNAYPGFAGRSRSASINSDSDLGVLDMTEESFTAECWVNAAKGTAFSLSYLHYYDTAWVIELTSLGEIKTTVRDLNNQTVVGMIAPIALDSETGRRVSRNLKDGQWHHLAIVLDRQAALLSTYIDGKLRKTTPVPSSFGQLKKSETNSHLQVRAIGGAVLVDELRVSYSAHTQEKIWEDYRGDHPVRVASLLPFAVHERRVLNRGIPTAITLTGFGIAGTTAEIRRNGVRVDGSVSVTESSYGQVGLQVEIAPQVPLGPAVLVLLLPFGLEVATPAEIIESHAPRIEPDTVLLWRLEEPGNGAVWVKDETGVGSGGGTVSSSSSVPGRFGLARKNPGADANNDGGALSLVSQSFTVEGWVKVPRHKADSIIFGRGTSGIWGGAYIDWGLSVLGAGGLRAIFRNTQNTTWTVDLEPLRKTPAGLRKCVIADDTWHHVALALNREAGQAEIYVDGMQEFTAAIPAGFGALRNPSGSAFRVGFFLGGYADPLLYGVCDDTRVSLTAHSPARIWQDFSGIGPARVTGVSPLLVQRDRTRTSTAELIIEGTQLEGMTAQLTRSQNQIPGVSVEVIQASVSEARLLISTSAQVALGPAELALTVSGTTFRQEIRIVEPSPLPRAPDTALLWHMENAQDGGVVLADSGPFRVSAVSAAESTSNDGRFGMGRRNAGIQVLSEGGSTQMGWSDFTVECWLKTGAIGRPYILAGRQWAWMPSYGLVLFPSGFLRARAVDTAGIIWETRVSPLVDTGGALSVKPLLDDTWHLVSMTVDRQSGFMKVYIDGLERGSTPAPAGFGAIVPQKYLYASLWDMSEPGQFFGAATFPGVIDDVRFSSTAHDSAQLAAAFSGTDGPIVTQVLPENVARGSSDLMLSLHGLGLAGATVRSENPSVLVQMVTTRLEQVDVRITLPQDLPLGPLLLSVSDPAGRSGFAELTITAPQPFVNPSLTDGDTLVLWHLDDERSGQITLAGSGDSIPDILSATSAAASLSVDGRFGVGRRRANLVASAGFGAFEPVSSSFTVECWVRTDPVDRTYSLVTRSDAEGSNSEFGIALLRSGVLRAFLYDSANRLWSADTSLVAYDSAAGVWKTCIVDDGLWHLVSMVVDGGRAQLRLYVDGELETSTPAPADFASLRNNGKRLRAGYRNQQLTMPGDGGGLAEFPGDLDEIRVLARARTAEEIRADFGLPPISPSPGVSRIGDGQTADREASGSPGRNAGGAEVQAFQNADQMGGETLVLWHLDERANGAVRVVGSGDAVPAVIGGRTSRASIAESGRFAGGRTQGGIVADPDGGALDFGASSFTLEFWLRTDPVFSTYTLAGRDGPLGEAKDFGVSLLPSGRLRAWLFDSTGLEWSAQTEIPVDDSGWRLITMSVNREAGWLYLLIDDDPVAAAPCPVGFIGVRNQGEPFRAGHIDVKGPVTFGGPGEFPGVLDEMRLLNYARKPAEGAR